MPGSEGCRGRLRRTLVAGVLAAIVMVSALSGPALSGLALATEPQPGGSQPPAAGGETASANTPDSPEERTPPEPSTPSESNGAADRGSAQEQQGRQDAAAQKTREAAAQNAREEAEARKAREQAAAAQRAREQEAERQAKAQALAEKRAAQLAAATARAQASWDGHGRPNKMIIVRQRTVDLVTNGKLTRQAPRSGGALTLSTLSRFVPRDWLNVSDGNADLSAAVVLTPGTSLNLGPDVKTVRLAGGPAASDAASIYTGSGRVALSEVTVSSFDPATGQPLPMGPGRPSIAASSGGRLEAVDSAINDLGTGPGDPVTRAALSMGQGSTGSLVRTSLARNGVGLKLGGTAGVRLEDVRISESAGDGLVLRGDTGTTLAGVKADNNGGNGVMVNEPSTDRPVTGISASGNKLFGLALTGQTKTDVTSVATADNGVGGVRVSWSTGVNISDLTSTGDAIGLYTHVGSAQILVDRSHITGARRGLHIEKTTRDLTVNATTIAAASVTGIAIGGKQIVLNQVAVTDSATGMRVERGSGDVLATGLTLTGGGNGIVALSATSNVVLRNLTTNGVSRIAVRTFSPALQVVDSRITGSSTGIDVGAATSITGTTIVEVDEGIRSRSRDLVKVDNADISALSVGINVAVGSPVQLINSRIDALEAIRGALSQIGQNQLSLPPMNLLGTIGVPLILLALVLEQVHAFRQRSGSSVRRSPPTLPAGAAHA